MRREQTATGSAMSSLHMDTGRFLYDDGHSTSWQAAIGKTQGVRRVGGCAAAGAHAALRMRQICRGPVCTSPPLHGRNSSNRKIDSRRFWRPEQ